MIVANQVGINADGEMVGFNSDNNRLQLFWRTVNDSDKSQEKPGTKILETNSKKNLASTLIQEIAKQYSKKISVFMHQNYLETYLL